MAKKARSRSSRELPSEILFYSILPRIPAKSVLRFKCVSKEWHSSLTTPWFEKLHLHHVTNDHHQNHHKLVALSTKTPFVFHTIDCEAPEDGLSATRPLPFKVSHNSVKVVASFGGLVCVAINRLRIDIGDKEYSHLILWNPLTGDYKTMSKFNDHYHTYWACGILALYYSSCDDDYKLLCLSTGNSDAYIYSLKSDSWRTIDSSAMYLWERRISVPGHSSTVLKEKIYTLYFLDQRFHSGRLRGSLVMFDTKTEKFTEMSTPSFNENQNIFHADFMLLGGCVHLYVIYSFCDHEEKISYFIELWRMNGDGGDWTKVETYQIPFPSNVIDQPQNGELLAYLDCIKGYVCKLVLTNPLYIKKLSWSYTPDPHHCLHIPSRGRYIETLVSPNRYR